MAWFINEDDVWVSEDDVPPRKAKGSAKGKTAGSRRKNGKTSKKSKPTPRKIPLPPSPKPMSGNDG